MSPVFRAAYTAGIAAFFSALVVGVVIYGILLSPYFWTLMAAVIALMMSLAAAVTAFATVWALVRSRYPYKRPVIGAMRGAAVGVGVLILITIAHAMFSPYSVSGLNAMFGQLFYGFFGVGWFAAAVGWFGGKYIERFLL